MPRALECFDRQHRTVSNGGGRRCSGKAQAGMQSVSVTVMVVGEESGFLLPDNEKKTKKNSVWDLLPQGAHHCFKCHCLTAP